jgi:hypothetical protein
MDKRTEEKAMTYPLTQQEKERLEALLKQIFNRPKDQSLATEWSWRDASEALSILQSLKEVEQQDSEFFFRWSARAEGGACTDREAVSVIFHHPENPYSRNNPWAKENK